MIYVDNNKISDVVVVFVVVVVVNVVVVVIKSLSFEPKPTPNPTPRPIATRPAINIIQTIVITMIQNFLVYT